jgi:hypothetical protein
MSIVDRADSAAIEPTTAEITTDAIRSLMQGISAMGQLGGLIADLEALRERMLHAGDRAERGVLGYARLSQSVAQLTTIASQGAVVMRQPIIGR